MKCIGINYKKVKIDEREKYSIDGEQQARISCKLKDKGLTGVVVLSTCNRTEIYFTYDGGEDDVLIVINSLSHIKNITIDEIMDKIYVYSEENAINHLFYVASGLDSMILGEDEILRQVKESYLFALDNGFSENRINMTFQGAFNCAKAVKTETMLSKTPVSYGTLAANTIERFSYDKSETVVLIVGITGKMGSILAKNLISKGYRNIIGTKRTRNIQGYENEGNDTCIKFIDFEDRYKYIDMSDVIVSVTSSPHFTFVADKVDRAISDKRKKRLFVDLAVPHDIDRRIGNITNCSYMDVDDFQYIAEKNSKLKAAEAKKAEVMIEKKVHSMVKKMSEQVNRTKNHS